MARKKRKKAADSTGTGTTTEVTDSSFIVTDSTQTAINIGSGTINQNIEAQQKPIRVHPYSSDELGLIRTGRRIMLALFGTLNHGMRGYTLGTSAATALGVLLTYLALYNNPYSPGSLPFLSLDLGGLSVLLLTVYFGWMVIFMSQRTQCPKCGERFRFTITKKTLMNSASLPDREVRNYRSTYSCNNPDCKYTEKNVQEVEEIETPSDE